MRRIINITLILALLLGLYVPALAAGQDFYLMEDKSSAPQFTDVPQNQWYYTWVTKAAQAGWVSGVGNNKFDPHGKVTYSQFAVMLGKALYADDLASQPKGEYWWTPACEVAAKHGLFVDTDMASRSNWTAVANKPMEREEMAQMMYNALRDVGAKLPTYEEYTEVAMGIGDIIDTDNYDAVATCYAIKLLTGTGNGNFDPHSPMTRAQAAVVLCNIYGYVTGDVTGSSPASPAEPEKPTQPDVPRPSGAVGARYNVDSYDVPADTNKDGWITEAEVQAVLAQLEIEYPHGSPWGSNDRWTSPVFGSGRECAGFAFMVSDKIFGDLPKYAIAIEDTRVGDVMFDGPTNHKSVILNDYGKLIFEGINYTEGYYSADGNVSGTVAWGVVNYYADYSPTAAGSVIYSRYPK